MGSLLSNRNVVLVAVVLCGLGAFKFDFMAGLGANYGLLLVLLGLVGGFMAGPNDQTRLFLSALVLKLLGDDAIAFGDTVLEPVGNFFNAFNGNLAIVVSAAAVMIVYMNVKNRLMEG